MKPFKPVYISLIFFLTFQFFSCGSDNQVTDNEVVDDLSQNNILFSTIEVFKTLPSPVETAELIQKTGVKFDENILNPVKNSPYYETSYSIALNLGVYCADLSYTTFYDQKQITMEYLSAVKAMADGLGLVEMIKKDDLLKLEDNLYDRDTIKSLIHDVFLSSGEFLNDNNRPEVALLVEVGGWIEGLYIAMQLAKQSGHINKELVDRVAEQRNSLILVISSLENFSNHQQINEVLFDLKDLMKIYDKMVVPEGENFDSNAVLMLTKNSKAYVTPEIFLNLYHQISRIRNSYTQ
ncbi:MAG: hypothetical protein P1P88_20015 [Bacteroidales bacterium]|nr:hypothetical protein [Bacteroidales bacterium]